MPDLLPATPAANAHDDDHHADAALCNVHVPLLDHVAIAIIQRQYRAHRRRVFAARFRAAARSASSPTRVWPFGTAGTSGLAVVAAAALAVCLGATVDYSSAQMQVRGSAV